MSQTDNSNALTWVLGGSLVLIGLFVVILLVSVNSQADSISTSTDVTNVAPSITLVLTDEGTVASGGNVSLSSGTTDTITFTGTITDTNGTGSSFASGDLASISAAAYRTNVSGGVACTEDNNECYKTNSATGTCSLLTFPTTTTATYSCTIPLQYWADGTLTGGVDAGTTWTAYVKVVDDSTTSGDASQTFEIETLLSLSIPSSINYGTLTREQSTTNSNNQEMTITQYGNDGADVEVSSAAAMTCTVVGSIPVANQKWSLTDLSAGATGVTALSGSAADTNLATGYRTSEGSALTKILYWNIIMPSVATGSCTGTTTISALAS